MERGDIPIAVGELSFKIAHAAAQGAVLFLCCCQLGGQIGAGLLRCFGGIATNVRPSHPLVSGITNGTFIPACTICQSGQACCENGGFECLHDDRSPPSGSWGGGIYRVSLPIPASLERASQRRSFRASRISINNFSSLVGPAGGAGGASFLNRLTCLTNIKITNAMMIKSNVA